MGAVNRNTGIWGKDAMEFIPQRWIDADGRVNNSGGVTSNYSIMTFLHGPRSCIGQGFARSELKCLVAALVVTTSSLLGNATRTILPDLSRRKPRMACG